MMEFTDADTVPETPETASDQFLGFLVPSLSSGDVGLRLPVVWRLDICDKYSSGFVERDPYTGQ